MPGLQPVAFNPQFAETLHLVGQKSLQTRQSFNLQVQQQLPSRQ